MFDEGSCDFHVNGHPIAITFAQTLSTSIPTIYLAHLVLKPGAIMISSLCRLLIHQITRRPAPLFFLLWRAALTPAF